MIEGVYKLCKIFLNKEFFLLEVALKAEAKHHHIFRNTSVFSPRKNMKKISGKYDQKYKLDSQR